MHSDTAEYFMLITVVFIIPFSISGSRKWEIDILGATLRKISN